MESIVERSKLAVKQAARPTVKNNVVESTQGDMVGRGEFQQFEAQHRPAGQIERPLPFVAYGCRDCLLLRA